MKKLTTILLLMSFFVQIVNSTSKDEDLINFYDGEFFLAEEEYQDALIAFKKVYNSGYENNSNLNYRIGICYLYIPGQKTEAIPYLEKAVENITRNYREGSFNETKAPIDAYLFLGNSYRIDYQLDKAIEAYNQFIKMKGDKTENELEFAAAQIEACKRAKKAVKNPSSLENTNIGEPYNSGMNDYKSVISHGSKAMAYMSEQKFYDAIFYAEMENGNYSDPVNITPQIQSDGDQFVTDLSHDGKELLLTKISSFDADIMISNFEDGKWTKSRNLGRPVNSKYFESHACFSPDGKTIYFTSNRKESLGVMDIFKSTKNSTGVWSEPKNLGSTINTELNEESPFISEDGKTLFFSSQGHSTIGGYDIFYSKLDNNGNWSQPKALPYPLNTTDDDLFFFPAGNDPENISGYMTRTETDGFGSGDIYKVDLISKEMQARLEEEAKKKKEAELARAKKEESLKSEKEVKSYSVKPLFFLFDSHKLSSIANQKLDELVQVLKDYPQLKVEVHGHADAIGTEKYNQGLSEKRAESAMEYLINNGIHKDRIVVKGFSEEKPVALNKNPDGTDAFQGRKLNRRVEFSLKPDFPDNISINPVKVPDELKVK